MAALEKALQAEKTTACYSLLGVLFLAGAGFILVSLADDPGSMAAKLMIACFFLGILAGIPIAFILGLSAMVFFVGDPSLPFVFYAQQMTAGVESFVLLSIPFFLLAGAANGSERHVDPPGGTHRTENGQISGRIEYDLGTCHGLFFRYFGFKTGRRRRRGRGIDSRRAQSKQNAEDATGILAAAAVPSESIPPCVNLIILGFVANISIGALFIAGIIPLRSS